MMNKNFNGNPNNNFLPYTNSNYNNKNNYNKYLKKNKEIMGHHNYNNNNNFIHNNIKEIMLKDIIQEYKIFIDSSHRDTTAFKNPCNFTVSFNPKSNPEPHILMDFKNVKFIRIEKILLPSYKKFKRDEPTTENLIIIKKDDGEEIDVDVNVYGPIRAAKGYTNNDVITSDDIQAQLTAKGYTDANYNLYDNNYNEFYFEMGKWHIYSGDPTESLLDDDYVILNIPELNTNTYGTNNSVNGSFSAIFFDKEKSDYKYEGDIVTPSHEFKDSDLGNIKKLTFQILDIDGNQISYDHIESDLVTNVKDTRHPLNKSLQIQIVMTIGVVEPTQNKFVQY